MLICGIDPGFSGAIALLNPFTRYLEVHDMPVLPNKTGKTVLDFTKLVGLLVPSEDMRNVAMIEQVSAMPGQGVSSMFRFGQCLGAIEATVHGHGFEVHYVTPSKWKKHFGLSSDKDTSRGLAKQRFPAQASFFDRKKDDGRAEAALLALYALETVYGLNQGTNA